ncbi:MAG: hypothetical protein F6K22_03955 [Okeania sp. SIO2F4]|uniref:hypothetical protein n=1 Tax=Okeania sp. SIO2F4 TaxID=2607790 RepID=UPI00142D0DC5|nr:hypothetical protein [Okeania sp. SIO2F4]NES02057.1 hypothetical protein [Okeania sp. SIO2F4]
MLSIQKSEIDFEKNLPGGIVYSQLIEELEDKLDYHTRKKSYFFQKDCHFSYQLLVISTFSCLRSMT